MMLDCSRALIVIDIQNDYFPRGAFPLWRADETLAAIENAVGRARRLGIPVILVQNVAPPRPGAAPFFTEGTPGVEIHPRLLAAAPEAPVVIKAFADSFYKTTLDETLRALGAQELLICGMMTQNCVTHTAISKAAERYKVTVFDDCSTTVDAMIHKFALRALAIRVDVALSTEILA
jgi:nicotinamidase-related amidase